MAECKRAIIVVMDSVGIGALPDAAQYGDTGADTLGSKAARMMDDPFGSIWIGLASTATAVSAVVGGIFGLSVIY